jgi:SNF2 family DNA or RNA helicase
MQQIHLDREPSVEAKLEAFTYQKVAVDRIKDLEYGALFHEQGLGKTKIAIDILLYWLKKKLIDSVVIVTKKQLIPNWKRELSLHTHLAARVLTNNKNDNYYVFNGPSRVIITNFETIPVELERFKLFLKSRTVAIIVDESAKLKNPESSLTKAFFELSPLFEKRIIMTGTPVANRPYDIWPQIYFLDQGRSLGVDFKKFKLETDLSNDLFESEERRREFEHNIDSIISKIAAFSVRETKNSGIIQLPPKDYYIVYANFEPNQQRLYEEIRTDALAYVMKNGVSTIDENEAVLKRLLRLIQITSNPRLVDEGYCDTPGKLPPLIELVENIMSLGDKCIVWTSFIQTVNWLYDRFSAHNPVRIHGKMDMHARDRSVTEFISNPEVKILIATPTSAKEGLTLTVANHAIFYDRSLSLDDYLQAQDRIHRISQKKPCKVYNILMQNSIDEWIDTLLYSKGLAAKLVQGDITLDDYKAKIDYSYSEVVQKILRGESNG